MTRLTRSKVLLIENEQKFNFTIFTNVDFITELVYSITLVGKDTCIVSKVKDW